MHSASVERRWTRLGDRRVSLHVLEMGLACCGVEVRSARRTADLLGALSSPDAPPPASDDPDPGVEDLHVLIVAGTVTTRLAPALVAAHADLPEPCAVVAFGACAATGGPYWDSYSVLPGAHEVVPVDVWVPGCPPRPEDLVAGLWEVLHAR